jgi:type II secretory pathway pseudopilin PulG
VRADLTKRRAGQTGITLIELVMTIFMLGIVMTICFRLLISTDGALKTADINTRNADQARLAVSQMDRQIRSGNLLHNPALYDGNGFLIYTQANGNQKCVEWKILDAPNNLITRSWSENWVSDGEVSEWQVVATNVVNRPTSVPSPSPAFSFEPGYGDRLINIRILANVDPKNHKTVTIESSVTGRNTQYGYSPDICATPPPTT